MIRKLWWVKVDLDPECGYYEWVEGSPTVGDVMMLHQRIYQTLTCAWSIWAKPWEAHDSEDPFDNIRLLTALEVAWCIWRPTGKARKRGPA